MNLAVGQVWRRPDGTEWTIEALRSRHRDAVLKNPDHKPIYVPQLAVLEGWTLVSIELPAGAEIDVSLLAKGGNFHLPDEGT